jgi:hypothetical protein
MNGSVPAAVDLSCRNEHEPTSLQEMDVINLVRGERNPKKGASWRNGRNKLRPESGAVLMYTGEQLTVLHARFCFLPARIPFLAISPDERSLSNARIQRYLLSENYDVPSRPFPRVHRIWFPGRYL